MLRGQFCSGHLQVKEVPKENFQGNLSMYKGITDIKVEVYNSKLVIKRSGQTTGDTLTYQGKGKWVLGNDEYSFRIEKGQVKEMHWDLISAYFILTKEDQH